MEGGPWQLVALSDVEHRDGVTAIQQLLHQVSAQKTTPSDHSAPFIALNWTQVGIYAPNNYTCTTIKRFKLTGRTRVVMMRSK